MHKLDQRGEFLLPLIIVILLLLGSIGFGAWAFMGRQDYKENVDQKISEAVTVAEENLSLKKDADFLEAEKLPHANYQGPAAFGTLNITYPKTWSVYANEKGTGSPAVSGFLHPRYVSADEDVNFALRYEVLNKSYEQELKTFESKVKQQKVSVSAYRLPKVDSVLGARVDGEITTKKTGVVILLPLRDKTIRIWTEGQEYRADFEEILKQLTFVP